MKTGVNILPINEPIVERIKKEKNYTKISHVINFVLQEYDKMTKQKNEVVEVKQQEEPQKKTIDYSEWFENGE